MDLTEGPIFKTLVLFSLPVLGTNVLQSLNGSINALWVGRLLGETGLAATSNANIILFVLLGAVFGVGMAATILVGQAIGRRDLSNVKAVVGTMTTFFIAMSLAVGAVGYLATPTLLGWMGTPPDARVLAVSYLRVIFLALPSLYLVTFLGMLLRGAGDSRTPFQFMLLSVALDIVLNPLLILGVGPLPRLGISGAALATLIAQTIALIAMLAFLYLRKSDLRLQRDELHYLRPDGPLLKSVVMKGVPMGLQMIVVSSSAMVVMGLVNAHGAETTAAYGVAVQLWTYVQMPAMAIGAAVSSMAAQNVGAGRWERVEQTARAGIGVNAVMTGALVLALLALDRVLVGWFLPEGSPAVAVAQRINLIGSWSFIFFGVTFVAIGIVRATGAVYAPLVILTISLFVVRLGFAKAFEPSLGADAIWWSFPVSMLVSMLLALGYYRWGDWRSLRMAPPSSTAPPAPAIEPLAFPESHLREGVRWSDDDVRPR